MSTNIEGVFCKNVGELTSIIGNAHQGKGDPHGDSNNPFVCCKLTRFNFNLSLFILIYPLARVCQSKVLYRMVSHIYPTLCDPQNQDQPKIMELQLVLLAQ